MWISELPRRLPGLGHCPASDRQGGFGQREPKTPSSFPARSVGPGILCDGIRAAANVC